MFLAVFPQTEDLPAAVKRLLRWRLSTITPQLVRQTITNSGLRLTKSRHQPPPPAIPVTTPPSATLSCARRAAGRRSVPLLLLLLSAAAPHGRLLPLTSTAALPLTRLWGL